MNEEELELKKLITKARTLKSLVSKNTDILKKVKEELRIFMVDSGIKEFDGVVIRRSFSKFDLELLRLENPKVFEKYCIREEHIIPAHTEYENTITKKNLDKLKETYPTIWNDPDYREELTARVYGL
jgi:hypothetical protein